MSKLVNKAYRFELKLNAVQENQLYQHAGASRFAYNWGLDRRINQYDTNTGKARYTNSMKQHKELNALKKSLFPWMYDLSKCAPQEALRDLDTAFKNFIVGMKSKRQVGFPKFKKKGRSKDSFRLYGTIKVFDKNHVKHPKRIQLPKLGKLKIKENPVKLTHRIENNISRILSATISRRAHKWYVNFSVKEDLDLSKALGNKKFNRKGTIGVDVGIKELAVLSDGTVIPNSRFLKRQLKNLKRLQRAHSRKVIGSNNRKKSALVLARLHLKIVNEREDLLHKLTTKLVTEYDTIVIEDLNIVGMIKNHNLAQAISDVSWSRLRNMLEYKCDWYGVNLVVADRFFASSKTCSSCGWKKTDLTLSDRTFKCGSCGLKIDRDLNAAVNLENYAVSSTACGGNPLGSPVKQKFGIV